MPSTYFIVDFAFNPDSDKPVAIFEFGDAFYSQYPTKKMGSKQLTPKEDLLLDIQTQNGDAVLIRLSPSGLDITSLIDNQSIATNDKENPSFSVYELCNSYQVIKDLLLNIISYAGSNKARNLIIHAAHPALYHEYDEIQQKSDKVKLVNHGSKTLMSALHNKAILAEFAYKSPIFPGTLIIPPWDSIKESDIDLFLKDYLSEYYVIKPAMGTRSEGVHVVPLNELKETLKDLASSNLKGLIVQVCHLSKRLKYNNEHYFAKSRAIVRADFLPDSIKPNISVITAFWELASTAASELLIDKNVIINSENVLEMSADELRYIRQEFTQYLPDIIGKMRRLDRPMINNEQYKGNTNSILVKKALLAFLEVQSVSHSYKAAFFNKNLIGMKHFIIDILGLNEKNHDWVNDSDDSIPVFAHNATDLFFGHKNKPLNHISVKSIMMQNSLCFLGAALISLLVSQHTNPSFYAQIMLVTLSAALGAISVHVVTHPAVTRATQSFFSPKEKHESHTRNEQQLNVALHPSFHAAN